jgi:hypothetical protein
VSRVDAGGGRVEIAGADGTINGWTPLDRVYGICTVVDGRPIPGAADKAARRR